MTEPLSLSSAVLLSNGIRMPRLGLGVYLAGRGEGTRAAVSAALEAGYRLIDTASFYGNEREVGEAVRASGIPRSEIFVTTKLWNDHHGYDKALRAFERSERNLNLGPVDLYLIHWPVPKLRGESWRALTRLLEEGRCRSIGVSNYMPHHLREMPSTPMVNQCELHPFLQYRELRAYCKERGIVFEAYSPLAKGEKLNDATVAEIAGKHGKSNAQILIRWSLQHDCVVIPKSSSRARIRENADVFDFELDGSDMGRLDALDEGYHSSWDPTGAP